jgi:hypothetical protein
MDRPAFAGVGRRGPRYRTRSAGLRADHGQHVGTRADAGPPSRTDRAGGARPQALQRAHRRDAIRRIPRRELSVSDHGRRTARRIHAAAAASRLADITTDREVWMLYTSFMRTVGPGMVWTYGREARAIAVGTTGGGPDITGHPQMPVLSWDEPARDLRLAVRWCDDIYIHSLEGCVGQGFLPRLRSLDWRAATDPPEGIWAASGLRRALRGALWASAHPCHVLGSAVAVAWIVRRWRTARR